MCYGIGTELALRRLVESAERTAVANTAIARELAGWYWLLAILD